MGEPTSSREEKKIQTFVFIDIESTGLAPQSPRILELSMIAVSRDDLIKMSPQAKKQKRESSPDMFDSPPKSSVSSNQISPKQLASTSTKCIINGNGQQTPTKWSPPPSPPYGNPVPVLPRVVHKYTRLYYPWKIVTPKAEEMTGLNNYMLQNLEGFTEASAEAIHLFLDLPKPVTLVAHNGNCFDFKLLKAELSTVDRIEDFNDLQCTDTLKAIRDIDALFEKEDILQITQLAASFSVDDMMEDDSDSPPTAKRTRPEDSLDVRPIVSAQFNNCTPEENQGPVLEVTGELPITPIKEQLLTPVKTPATPYKSSNPLPSPVTPEAGKSYASSRGSSKVRRNLTYEGSGKRKFPERMPYKQVNIYHRLFGLGYSSHRAESDCQALLEICGHYGERFVDWADTFSESFAEVKPMWMKRKTFTIN